MDFLLGFSIYFDSYDETIFVAGIAFFAFSWWVCFKLITEYINRIKYLRLSFCIISLMLLALSSIIIMHIHDLHRAESLNQTHKTILLYKTILTLFLSAIPYSLISLGIEKLENKKKIIIEKMIFYPSLFILLFFLSSGVFYYVNYGKHYTVP